MKRMILGTGVILAIAASSSYADNLPFVGNWGGGPTDCAVPFKFTAKTYQAPNDKPLKIMSMKRNGDEFSFKFADDYAITVQVRKNDMTWLSEVSGDTFELKRCK